MTTSRTLRCLAVSSWVALVALAGCTRNAPPPPEPGSYHWTTYVNDSLGYEVDHPDVYQPQIHRGGESVIFRWAGKAPVKISWGAAAEGARRGLWSKEEPTGESVLGGRPATTYEYVHCDGPFCARMMAFVVVHRGRELGLEFHSDGELSEFNRVILNSFRFTDRP